MNKIGCKEIDSTMPENLQESLSLQQLPIGQATNQRPGAPATSYQCAVERLHEAGYRITQQRAQLLGLLVEECQEGKHLTADTLYARAQDVGLDISLATVYRALAVFKELGLVAQHHFSHDASREVYEVATWPTHHHFTCLGCGAVIEFEAPDVQDLAEDLAYRLGLQVCQASLYLQGYCHNCAPIGENGC
jgi:Fe2+ or Zn2+ uptake regulation protein